MVAQLVKGVTGVSTLALGSIITLISIIFGASLMMKIEYYKAVYEDSSFSELLKNSLIDLRVLPEKLGHLRKFSIFGALAQLVEQWPFKPFVTGSNPVRPIIFFVCYFSLASSLISAVSDDQIINIKSHNGLTLNANLKSNPQSDTIFILVHGTRGYKDMEIIKSLSQKILDYGHSSLSINLSYDIDDRTSEFLSWTGYIIMNISINEIVSWYKYLENQGYKNIYFIGHSRGAFNVIQAMALINNNNIKAYLLAPVIDTYLGTKTTITKSIIFLTRL